MLAWIIEDQQEQIDLLKELLREAFDDLNLLPPVQNASAALSVIADIDNGLTPVPDVVILDLMLRQSSSSLMSELGGISVFNSIRGSTLSSKVPVCFRTGFPDRVPAVPDVDLSSVFTKGDDPALFLGQINSFLSAQGKLPSRQVVFAGELRTAMPARLSGWKLVGASSAAVGVWVASVLQVTSELSGAQNTWLVVGGLVGGFLLGCGSWILRRGRWVTSALGVILALVCSLVIPRLWASWANQADDKEMRQPIDSNPASRAP